jgi:tetrahydromethanopterin S-methyltransferase subunit B
VVAEVRLCGFRLEREGDDLVSGVDPREMFSGSFVGREDSFYVFAVHEEAFVYMPDRR